MSAKTWLGKVLIYLVLELGALCGVPMRPDQIEQCMKINETKIAQVRREDDDGE